MWKFTENLTGMPTTQDEALALALHGPHGTRSNDFLARGNAAAVLHELAHHGEYGGYNADINPEDVGRALSRLMPNCPGLTEQEIKDRLIQGFLENSDSG